MNDDTEPEAAAPSRERIAPDLIIGTAPDGQFGPDKPPTQGKAYPVCGAKTRTGGTCKRACVVGRNRCKLHGGATLRGAAHGNFKHGFYSKAMPSRLRGDFDALLNDPKQLEGRAELAILQVRLQELVARLETGESAGAWEKARAAFDKVRQAEEDDNDEVRANALEELGDLLREGTTRERAWNDATELIERVSKVGERESKRQAREQQSATAEQVRALVASMTNAVLLYVTDATTRQKIAEHVQRFGILQPASPAPELS